jgi:hypothetical protein
MSADAAQASRVAGFRYGVVFLLTLGLLVFEIVAPDTDWARAAAVGLGGLALTVVVATSRARAGVRRTRALAVAAAWIAAVILIGAGVISKSVAFAIGGVLAAAIPAALAGGVVRLVREKGVTLRAVLGAVTIYLSVGLLFAWVIAVVAAVDGSPYFVQPDVSQGDTVYFSFTVLTTTGFGDYTAATATGHALAVVEMLLGQLYLVTVIGVLVGGFAGGRGARS